MFFMSCWRGWTPWNGNGSPYRGRRPTTTSTRSGKAPSVLDNGACPGEGLRRGKLWVARLLTPHPCCALQGRACRLRGKEDAQDFTGLVKALQVLGLCTEELTAVWAVLASVLQLGNICFSSSEVSSL